MPHHISYKMKKVRNIKLNFQPYENDSINFIGITIGTIMDH